jgi:hypothetical protein
MVALTIPGVEEWGANEASLPQLTSCASALLHFFSFFRARVPWHTEIFLVNPLPRIPRRHALTSFSILSNIRLVSWGVQRNGKDLAMLRFRIFPTRRVRRASKR